MDGTLKQFLEKTARSIAEVEARIDAQKELLAGLERDGGDPTVARQMLRAFQANHAMLKEHHAQLLRLLED
jgi:uncharacterized protein (UPF0335 family)